MRDGLQAGARARDVDRLRGAAEALSGEHQQAVVRAHEQASLGGGAQRERPPRVRAARAHAGIYDGQVHARGHVCERPREHDRTRAHVVARDAVRDVDHARLRAAPSDHPMAGAHELVAQAVVGEECDDGGARRAHVRDGAG